MKIGDSVDVNMENMKPFRSKIMDIKGKDIYINYPSELSLVNLEPPHPCSIHYIEHDIPHRFDTTIEYTSVENIPYFTVSYPDKEDIERIQRREYVRIQTDVDIAIHFEDQELGSVVTITWDISGGGLRAVLKEELPVMEGAMADVYLVLKSAAHHYEYIRTKARVVRTHIESGVHFLSMEFLIEDEEEKKREKIISYCFEVQRQKRKSGL